MPVAMDTQPSTDDACGLLSSVAPLAIPVASASRPIPPTTSVVVDATPCRCHTARNRNGT
ncbi:hypothetical protein ACFQUX_29115 [Pantoea stewartii]